MKKTSKLVKKITAVGTKADAQDLKEMFDPPVPVVFRDGKGRKKCAAFLELADTRERRERGLSKRASLGKMSGMVFNCRGPFWMKDVEFPLDLVFTDRAGHITEKTAMAMDRSGSTLYPAHDMRSMNAIELPRGFCDKYGVDVGDTVSVAELRKA